MQAIGNTQPFVANIALPDRNEEERLLKTYVPNRAPACKISRDYWLSLRERSVTISDELVVLDIKQAACSEESKDQVLSPELFDTMDSHYHHSYLREYQNQWHHRDKLCSDSMREAMGIMKVMQDIRQYPSLFAELGQKICEGIESRNQGFDFLEQPVPVLARNHRTSFDKQRSLSSRLKPYLRDGDSLYDAGELKKLGAFCDVKNHMPYQKAPLPDINWLTILTEAMNKLASVHGLAMDFSKTPIFLNFVQQDIADEILKVNGFFDSPVTGNITHGMVIHACQILFGYMMGVLNEKNFAELVDERLFASVLDLNPNDTADSPVILMADEDEDEEDKKIIMVNYEALLSGRTTNSCLNLLIFGLVSQVLEKGLSDDRALEQALPLLKLPSSDDKELNRDILRQKIRSIRALEYTIAGVTFQEGAKAVDALAREVGDPQLQCLNDLFKKYSEINLGDFDNNSVVKTMQKGMVEYYLQKRDEFSVYQQVEAGQTFKLRPISSMTEFIPDTGYVVYPAGAEPPEVCKLK